MPLDTSLLAVRPGEFSLPSTSANELLAQATLKQKQQEMESQNALRKATQGLDLNTSEGQQAYVNALRAGGYHSEAQDFVNKLATQKKTEAETQATQMDIFNKNKDTISKLFLDAANNPSDENLIAHANTAVTLGLDKDMVGGMLSDIFTLPPEQRAAAIRNFGLSAEKQVELNKPPESKQFQPTATEAEYALWQKDPAAYRKFKEAQKVETGGGAKATEIVDDTGITKAERNKREAAYPKAKLSFTNASSDIDTLISDLNTLKSHKGLSGITGLVYGRTPGITGEARAAEALLEKILSRGQFRSLQELRNNSPTGGAVGNVSDFEGRALRSSFGALDRKQDTPDFQNAIDDVIDQLKSSKQNLTGAFEDTYSYRSGGTPSTPAAGTTQTKVSGKGTKDDPIKLD